MDEQQLWEQHYDALHLGRLAVWELHLNLPVGSPMWWAAKQAGIYLSDMIATADSNLR